ncbi:MAG TPA: amidohydrolase family protein, partial [Phycisphaerae bacterium]
MFQILIVALLPGSVVALDTFDPPVAITNARIVVGDGSVIERGTILIEEGRIKAVGAGVNVPAGADRLDVEGAFVYPGFVDAHSFVGIPNKPRTPEERQRTEDQTPDRRQGPPAETDAALRRGVRAHLRAEELFAPSESDLESFRKSGITTVLVAPRSGVLAGRSAWIELSGLPLRRALLRSEVAQHASFDVGEPGDYPNSLLGVFALFRQTLLDARWYVQMEKYAARHPSSAPRTPRDTVLEALQPLLARSVPLVFEANEENEILRALNLAAEFNLKPMISGAKEAYRLVDRLKNERVDLIVSLKFDEEPEYGKDKQAEQRRKERQKQEAAATQPEDEKKVEKEKREEERSDEKKIYEPLKIRQERRRIWEEHVANIIKLHEAGIPFALSTREFEKPAELLEHLRKVIQRGLPEEAALAALTRTPAGMFGLQEQLGTIAAGRLANLTILDKPLADEKSKTQWVFIEGKKFQVDLGRKEKKSNDRNEPRMNADERGSDASQAEESPPETQAALAAASQPSDEGPSWRSEIEADRVPPTHTGGNVLIRNGTLLTVTHGILPNTSILIRDGKIREMGRDIQAPEGVTVIDATGRFVSPGLIDCHSHMAIDAVNESALSVSAEVRIADVVNNRRVPIYRALAGGITTTHAMHGSANPIGGQNTIFKLKYNRPVSEMLLPNAPRTVKFALGENVIQSNWQDAWGKRFPNTRMGVEGTIRRAFMAAREYAREWADYRAKSAAGQDAPPLRRDLRLEALSEILAGDITVHCHCYRADEILRLLDIAETFGIRVGVLHHVLEGYRIAPEIARHGCGASTFANMWAYKVEAFNAVPYNAALLTRQGICTTVNSDSSNTIRF